MRQPPIGDFECDRNTVLHRGRVGRRPYLMAAPVVVALAAVALIGASGPHRTPSRSNPTSPISAATSSGGGAGSGALAGVTRSADPSPSTWSESPPGPTWPGVVGPVSGLANVRVNEADVIATGLEAGAMIPLAAYQGSVLYVSGTDLLMVNPIKYSGASLVVEARPCSQIVSAAMNATLVIYSEVAPGGSPQDDSVGCPDWGPVADWEVTIVDTIGGGRLEVAAGTYDAGEAWPKMGLGPLVAIADHAYAFSRSDPSGNLATVEVHALGSSDMEFRSGRLKGLTHLLLADTRLVVAADPASDLDRSTHFQQQAVMAADDWSGSLQTIGYTTGAVSLSRDGTRVAFGSCDDEGLCQTIRLREHGIWQESVLPAGIGCVSVDSGDLGTLAWTSQSAGDDPTSYLGIRNRQRPMSAALVGVAPPVWINVQDGILAWVSFSEGGLWLYEIDLAWADLHE